MRILHLSTYTWSNGGPTVVVHDYTKLQIANGHSVEIVSPYREGDKFYIVPEGAKLHTFKLNWFSKFYPDFSIGIVLFLIKNLKNYDIVHVHGLWNFPGLYALMTNLKIKKLLTIHGTIGNGNFDKSNLKRRFFSWLIQKKAALKADFIQVHNENELQNTINYFKPQTHKNIHLITNAIDFKPFENLPKSNILRNKFNLKDTDKIILFFGRLHEIKGIEHLLRAFQKIAQKFTNTYLIFAGADTGYLDKINQFKTENQLNSRILYYGLADNTVKIQVLSDANLYVLPSYSESFSIATIEAMAASLPIVVSDFTGLSKLIRENNTGLIAEINADSLAENIEKLLNNPDLALKMGQRGREFVKNNLTIEKVAKPLMDEVSTQLNNQVLTPLNNQVSTSLNHQNLKSNQS
jgi:glycosyltransferase involved in cell wall biosynthesis